MERNKASYQELSEELDEIIRISEFCKEEFVGVYFPDDRMFLYEFIEKQDYLSGKKEPKLGEKWVDAGKNPYERCWDRVRSGLNVRKDKADEGEVFLVKIWDATEYAKKHGRYKKGGHVDDHVRGRIGFRKINSKGKIISREVHTIDPLVLVTKVNEILSKDGQPLPNLKLSTAQWKTLAKVLTLFFNSKYRIMADLFARFGKTLFSAALAVETETRLTIVASYVKTVMHSYTSQITSYEEFRDIIHVDTQEDAYQDKINKALSEGKQVFAYLSMNKGDRRKERIDFLYSREVSRLTLVEEADYGSHQPGQANLLINAIGDDDRVILLTGTNSDRAVTSWRNLIQGMIKCTLYQALVYKSEARKALRIPGDRILNA